MARRLSKKVPGAPGVKMRSQTFGGLRQFNNPIFKKRSVRTLIKRDESKGVRMPEFGRITDQKGVDTGRGFASGGVSILRSTKRDPQPTTGNGRKRVVKANLGPLKRRKNGV